jgi:hypothetical protein
MIVFSANVFQPFVSKMINTMPLRAVVKANYFSKKSPGAVTPLKIDYRVPLIICTSKQ